MQIKVEFLLDNPGQLGMLARLFSAQKEVGGPVLLEADSAQSLSTSAPPEVKVTRTRKVTRAPEPKPEPEMATVEDEEEEDAPASSAVSADDVRDVLIKLGRAKGRDMPRKLLEKYDAKTVSDLSTTQRQLVVAEGRKALAEAG